MRDSSEYAPHELIRGVLTRVEHAKREVKEEVRMSQELPEEIKRWTAQRKTALHLQILRGETTPNEAARKYDLKASDILAWKDAFLAAGERGLKTNPNDELQEKERKIDQLHRKIGEMTMDFEVLEKANEIYARNVDATTAVFGSGSTSKS